VHAAVEDAVVEAPADGGASPLAARQLAHLLDLAHPHALLVALAPQVPVAPHLDLEPRRQRVGHRRADAVQAARDLVAAAAELAAGVQAGEDELERRDAGLLVDADRDAATVVVDGDDALGIDLHDDLGAVPGERLVDRVVDDLPDEVVQPARARAADVHAGALAYRVEALEDLDLVRVVPIAGSRHASQGTRST
jgi:hypothetical protein